MADNQQFDVFFRGDILPGETLADVKGRLGTLFKLESTKVDQLFSGRPTAIRRNLDEVSAKKYQQALLKIGAVTELRQVQPLEAVAPATGAEIKAGTYIPSADAIDSAPASDNTGSDLSLAPAHSDVLRPEERVKVEPADVDISGLSLEAQGGDLLHEDEKKRVEERRLDLSHLEILPS